ncbi:MAG: hypothetical protein MJZ16_04830, partial [Bacteroidales bacterium]|nr:hypothetical protein [Bacteroidales bacterium]
MIKFFNSLRKSKDLLVVLLLLVAGLLLVASMTIRTLPGNASNAARKVSEVLDKRMEILDGYMERAMQGDHSSWMRFDDLPQDMVIYRYVSDTLQSWKNQFSVINDDIRQITRDHSYVEE